MGKFVPLGLLALGLFGLASNPPGAWPLSGPAWQGLALGLLLLGVLGLLHLSSSYLQSRIVTLAWILTRNPTAANRVYFTLMRPGVVAHELAHAIAAALVGGRVLAFNALETTVTPGAGGQVRLGHVSYSIPGRPTALGTRLRDAFVGLAPLPFGLLLIAAALGLSGVDWQQDLAAQLPGALTNWRVWLALVAIIEVADQMTPSSTDRKNWPAGLLVLAVLAALAGTIARVLAFTLPPAWWALLFEAGLVLAGVLAVPLALNLVLGALLWIVSRPLRR